jgi:molecular chaperone HtpG
VGDSPYRVAHPVVEAPRDTGIVGDVIAQFADPFAFLRELVQNAIDAGTPSIDVSIEYDEGAGAVRAAVRDQGEGMSREIVENQLLVLFRSTKENDDTKIGKFGVGFASVLSPQPSIVTVQTSRDGRRHTLHLHRDLSYELFDAGPATRTGTTVELEIPLAPDAVGDFVASSRAALVRWCRHAAVPIKLTARGPGGAGLLDERIDRPLAIDGAVVEARATSSDGMITAVVGITADYTRYAGFFDQGLTLYEGSEAFDDVSVAFKVQDARLAHTISRDNVRRDGAYERALDFVRRVVRDDLPNAALAAVRAAADAGDRERYAVLAHAIAGSGIVVTDHTWWFMAIQPIANRRAFVRAELGAVPAGAHAVSPITTALAELGLPVIDLGAHGGLFGVVGRRLGRNPALVDRELVRIAPVELTDADQALLALLPTLLSAACGRDCPIRFAALSGGVDGRLAITADPDDAIVAVADPATEPWLVERKRTTRKPFGLFRRPPIVIDARVHAVAAARELAETDPATAASVLARLVLVDTGALDVARSELLFAATLIALEGER